MDSLTELQRELNRVACPQCHHSRFDLTLQCESGYNECLYTATCLSCGYTFTVSTESKTLHRTHQDIEKRLLQHPCPSCGESGAHLKFRCDLNDRTCLYVATCNHCGDIIHQYR